MKIYIVILFSVFALPTTAQQLNCDTFRNGKFRYLNPEFSKIAVARLDSIQTEYMEEYDIMVEGTIQWTSSCEYVLTYTGKNLPEFVGKRVFVTITDIAGNVATTKAICDGVELILKMEKSD